MNAKKCKQLRKMARSITASMAKAGTLEGNGLCRMPNTRHLIAINIPNSPRGVYRRLKTINATRSA